MSLNHVRPWRNIYRRTSRKIHVGSVPVGGDAPISVQTMTNTDTTDVKATVAQVLAAAVKGLVREELGLHVVENDRVILEQSLPCRRKPVPQFTVSPFAGCEIDEQAHRDECDA